MQYFTVCFQGATNSIDAVDVGAGYAGLADYAPIIIGAQMLLNSYMGPVNVMIGL